MNDRFEQLDALIADLLDERLDAAGRAQLQRMLRDNAEARRHYAEFVATQSMIRRVVSRRVQGSGFRVQAEVSTPTLRPRRSVWYLSAASVAALIALTATAWFVYFPEPRTLTPEPSAATQSIAMLSDISEDVVFEPSDQPLALGHNLAAGPIHLRRGTAQVLFGSGAVVDLTGPCEFRMINAQLGVLSSGAIQAYVPEAARGFTVQSPHATVIDLGTRFGMHALPAGPTRIRVREGHVQVIPRLADLADRAAMTLGRGQQVTIDPAAGLIARGAFAAEGVRLSIASVRACNTSGEPRSPDREQVEQAVDNNFASKYLNANLNGAGLAVCPAEGLSIVRSLTLTAAADHAERDPASFIFEGSNDGGESWAPIASGPVPAFATRSATQTIAFENDAYFAAYRVSFPTVAGRGATCVQIAEVEIAADELMADVTHPELVAAAFNLHGEPKPNDPKESAARAIDNDPSTKYLNFNKDGAGLTITLDAPAIVRGLSLTTANDDPERDPASFTLQGSRDGERFVDIMREVNIAPVAERYFTRNYGFENDAAYRIYRVIFPRVVDADSTNSMQIAEIQLFAASPASGVSGVSGGEALSWRSREPVSQREMQ